MLKTIEKEIKNLENIQGKIENTIKSAPEGNLRCAVNKGRYQYYLGKTYLAEDKKDYIKQLAQKEYCKKLSSKVEKRIRVLKELRDMYKEQSLEDTFRSLHPARKQLVEPLIEPIEEIIRKFEDTEYEGKGFSKEDETSYYTVKGERVRSKSEKIIADEFCRYGIPYKYEMPVELKVKYKKIRFYPDFTVLNKRTGQKWFVEHLGMMDKISYFDSTMQKLDIYEKNNILLGEQLLLFHETSSAPLDTRVLKKYIERYLC